MDTAAPPPGDESPDALRQELEYWRTLALEREKVIGALHEFNYWWESTVARGEVIAGLEDSVEAWRERCLAAEANVRPPPKRPAAGLAQSVARRGVGVARRVRDRVGRKGV